ncbi:MAG: hypothetical protein QXD23_02640 [Candidatus Micrarchaeaceae archaeon]
MKFFKTLLISGEEELFIKAKGLTTLAKKSNDELGKLINKKSSYTKISNLKKRSSNEYFLLSHLITSGSIAPNLIDDMLLLLNKEENILESIFKISRQYIRYTSKDKKINEYLGNVLLSFNNYAKDSINLLSKMHESKTLSQIKIYRSKIKEIENEGDMLRDSILDFAYSSDTDFKLFYHIIDLAYMCDDVLDACEDASDLFLSIMLSILS